MKKIALFAILILSISLVWGTYGEWQDDGIPVRQGVNIEWFRSAIDLPDGGCVYAWSDTRLGDRDVYAQRVDTNGDLLWGDGGALINAEIDRQEDIVVINGADDETIYAWVDFRNEIAGDIYAQKLDGDGNLMWAEAGVELCLAEGIQISLNIVSDGNGGAYIIWLDERNVGGSDIFGTHIESDGSIADGWEADGNALVVAEGAQKQHTFWEDGEGGAVCVWHDERDPSNPNLYMQRITADGTHLWDENGSILCDAEGSQESGKMSPDGSGGFIISWRDFRQEFSGDIFANRIDLDGNILWEEDLVVYTGPLNQRNPRVTKASDGGVIVVWEDDRTNGEFFDLYAQKINLDGDILWDADGVIVCDALNHQKNPRLTGDDNGGAWIIWDDGRDGDYPNIDIYFQHFDSNGAEQLEDNGRVICDAYVEQFSPLIKRDDTGQVYFIWGDNRTGSTGIYHQLLDSNDDLLLAEEDTQVYYGLCGDGTNYSILGRDNSRLMFWQDTRMAVIASQIYMQILNDDGSFGFIEDGVPITEMTGSNQINLQSALMGEDAVLVWEEQRDDKKKTYVQKIGDNGEFQWGDMGLQLSDRDTNHHDAQLSVMGNDLYVGWCDEDDNFMDPTYQICAQKVVDGEIQWDEEGVVVAENEGTDDVLKDVVENYFIYEMQEMFNYNILVNKLTADGEIADGFAENGNVVCDAPANQQNPKGLMTDDGLLVIWEDLRDSLDKDIYGQIVAADGSMVWEANGKALVLEVQDQSNFNVQYRDGYIYMIWEDMRNGADFDIYMQKYDLDGNEQWTAGGVAIAAKPNQQANAAFTMSDESILIYWDDVVNDNDIDLYTQKIDYDGNVLPMWDPNGTLVCGAIKSQQHPVAVTDGAEDYSYVIWSDFRSSGKTDIFNIYAQKLSHSSTALDEYEIEDMYNIGLSNYPNPFRGGTYLSFALNADQLVNGRVEIFNVKGQKINSLNTENSSVYWDGKDSRGRTTATGIYMYQFKNDNFKSNVKKMIRLK